jgi:hypothetical protein
MAAFPPAAALQHRALAADTHYIPLSLQILTTTRTAQHEARFDKRRSAACEGAVERYCSGSFYVGPRGKSGAGGNQGGGTR